MLTIRKQNGCENWACPQDENKQPNTDAMINGKSDKHLHDIDMECQNEKE